MQQLDPYRVPWFADVAPSLLTNRTIRNYLASYSEQSWPQVVKMTILYGIVRLQQQHSGQVLTLQQLKEVVQAAATHLVVQHNVPGLQRQILQMQTDLDKVFDRLTVEPFEVPDTKRQAADQQTCGPSSAAGLAHQHGPPAPQQPPHNTAQHIVEFAPAAPQQRRARRVVCRNVLAPKPSGVWRAGEPSGFTSPPRAHPLGRSQDNQGATNPIYPDWWLCTPKEQPQAAQHQQQPRQQPRLAYSISQQPQQQPVTADDLITPEYLVVSSSGYGQQPPAPVVPGVGPPIMISQVTADGISTRTHQSHKQPPQDPQQLQPVEPQHKAGRGSPLAVCQLEPVRRPAARQVESKIKQAVAAARRKAARHMQQRQQLLATAVSGRTAGETQQSSSLSDIDDASCPPAAVAEQFISNPWSSWFMPGAAPDMASATLSTAAMQGRTSLTEWTGQQHISSTGMGCSSSSSGNCSRPSTAGPPGSVVGPGAAMGALGDGWSQDISQSAGLYQHGASSGGGGGLQEGVRQSAGEAAGILQQPEHKPQLLQHQEGMHLSAGGAQQARQGAWAFDFGHLDVPELDKATTSTSTGTSRPQSDGGKHRQLWSEKWVGNFGHLEGPRFSSQTAFSHHHQSMGQTGVGSSPEISCSHGLLKSPSQLQQLVDAGAYLSGLHTGDDGGGISHQQWADITSRQHDAAEPGRACGKPPASGDDGVPTSALVFAGHGTVSSAAMAEQLGQGWLEATTLRDASPSSAASGLSAAAAGVGEVDAASQCSTQEPEFEANGGHALGLTNSTNLLRQAIARHSSVMQLVAGL